MNPLKQYEQYEALITALSKIIGHRKFSETFSGVNFQLISLI